MADENNKSDVWKNAESIPRYDIGDMSRLFGIHPQSLRFYEKSNLISPMRTENSNRRKYANYDMYQIALRMQYKNIGFSGKETERLLHFCDEGQLKEELIACSTRLEEEKRLLWIKEEGIRRLCEALDRITMVEHHCVFRKRPVIRRYPHHTNGVYDESKAAIEARRLMMETMPLSFYLFEFPNTVDKLKSGYSWYTALEERYAKLTVFSEIKGEEILPEENCLYTIFSITGGDDAVNIGYLKYAFDFIEMNQWRVTGPIYGSAIANTTREGQIKRYLEAWIPVEDKATLTVESDSNK